MATPDSDARQISRVEVSWSGLQKPTESRMRDGRDWERRFAVIAVAFVLAVAVVTWRPWNTAHVEYNPGPSGTPGSTVLNETPPPAEGPSGTTTGMTR